MLPDIAVLRRLTQSLAVLDAILSPEWEMRYFSFNARWAEQEMLASMRNGSGDGWFLWFGSSDAIGKGFAHESPMVSGPVWKGVLSEVPTFFQHVLADPAFAIEETTFCIWRTAHDNQWCRGNVTYPPADDPDGSAELLALLDGDPKTYQRWAHEYYEVTVSLSAVEHIYQHRPLIPSILARLNSEITLEDLSDDLKQIGYPM